MCVHCILSIFLPELCGKKNHGHITQVFHRTRESTEYTVLTHIGAWVKKQLIFFIPDANLTSNVRIGSV